MRGVPDTRSGRTRGGRDGARAGVNGDGDCLGRTGVTTAAGATIFGVQPHCCVDAPHFISSQRTFYTSRHDVTRVGAPLDGCPVSLSPAPDPRSGTMRAHKAVASAGEPGTPGGASHKLPGGMEEDWSLVDPGSAHHGAAKHPPSPRDRRGAASPSRQKAGGETGQQLRWALVAVAITALPAVMLATYCRLLPRCSPEAVRYCGAEPCFSTGASKGTTCGCRLR